MITSVHANTGSWIQTGKKAANGNEALYAIFALFSFLFSYLQAIVDNQKTIYEAISRVESGQRKP